MKNRVTQYLMAATIATVLVSSCVPLTHVNELSSSSYESINKYEEIGIDYKKACIQRCKIDKLERLEIDFENCDCAQSERADSVTLIIVNAVKNYFDGLSKLSDNELTTYKLDDLTNALAKGDYGDIKIDEDRANSYSKISKILLKAITDNYRKKKLSTYVTEAQEPLMVLLDALDINTNGNLIGRLEAHKAKLQIYYQDISNDASISEIDKKSVFNAYSKELEKINTWEAQIRAYSKGIEKIKKGHTDLAENIDEIKTEEVRVMLAQYSSDIEAIKTEINKLQNN